MCLDFQTSVENLIRVGFSQQQGDYEILCCLACGSVGAGVPGERLMCLFQEWVLGNPTQNSLQSVSAAVLQALLHLSLGPPTPGFRPWLQTLLHT